MLNEYFPDLEIFSCPTFITLGMQAIMEWLHFESYQHVKHMCIVLLSGISFGVFAVNIDWLFEIFSSTVIRNSFWYFQKNNAIYTSICVPLF